MNRRSFLRSSSALSLGLAMPFSWMGNQIDEANLVSITILHTNDLHSRIDPFPMDGGRFQGLGGVSQRAALIKKIREQEENVILLDAGDILQGTPYFNLYKGELEFDLMNKLGYEAATIGNHDFDAGIETLASHTKNATFSFITANYNFKNTPMQGMTKPYMVIEKSGIRFGVTGVGIELEGLVPQRWYGETQYLDPVQTLNEQALFLKQEETCDYVICLSHLGYEYSDGKICDLILAEQTQNVDLIIGGHTHTFLNQPVIVKNAVGQAVMINQVGWAGVQLGRIEVVFERNKRKRACRNCQPLIIGPN